MPGGGADAQWEAAGESFGSVLEFTGHSILCCVFVTIGSGVSHDYFNLSNTTVRCVCGDESRVLGRLSEVRNIHT